MAEKEEWESDESDVLLPSDSGYGDEREGEKDKKHGSEINRKAFMDKLKQFPFSVFFIVGNEFCERFSYYGMRAVLVLFLTHQLNFGDDSATAIYHAFIMLCYLLPLVGAIISDSCLGKYGTILSLSIVYAIGNIIVSVSAIPFNIGVNIALAAVGLVVIALGTGGIKPCVSAFGGDQFKEDQKDILRYFFSLFYFSINAGSVISTLLTPILRDDVNCFDTGECFALAFGVPAVLMILSLVIFVLGTRYYVIVKPKKESAMLFLNVPACVAVAIFRRFRHGKLPEKTHFLQYASPKFSEGFIEDVRLVLRVLIMFLPLPIFWALFDQQGSRWTLQAVRMNGQLGEIAIKPDQMQALNPILILVFIPIFEIIIYPIFAKCRLLKKPLQRMVVGMILAGLAFMVAGFVQLQVQAADTSLERGHAKAVVINTTPDTFNAYIRNYTHPRNLSSAESFEFSTTNLNSNLTLCVSDETTRACAYQYSFSLQDRHVQQIILAQNSFGDLQFGQADHKEELPEGGSANLQIFNAVDDAATLNFSLYSSQCNCSEMSCKDEEYSATDIGFLEDSDIDDASAGRYYYCVRSSSGASRENAKLRLETGATYSVLLTKAEDGDEEYSIHTIQLHEPNSVSLFLQIPMYVLITAGEVLFSITGLEFAYSQAPVSMKAVCQAAWLWTVAFGNLIVIIIAESSIFANQAIEFFFFAICIGALALLFAIMSFFYKYVDLSRQDESPDSSLANSQLPDETRALILSQSDGKLDDQSVPNYTDDKGNESEF